MSETERVMQILSAYLAQNPDCADTLTGIHQWWLRNLSPPPRPEVLQAALNRLVASGRLQTRHYANGRVLYAAPRDTEDATKGAPR